MLNIAKKLWAPLLLACLALFYANEIWKSSKSAHAPAPKPSYEHPQYEPKHDSIFADFWNWTTQDALSFYTSMLALFSGVLVVVSFIQIRYLIRADLVARKSAAATRRSAIAAKKSADVLPALERAYLFVRAELEYWDPVPAQDGESMYSSRLGVQFRFENHGKTPAVINSLDAQLRIWSTDPDNTLHVPSIILPPEQIVRVGVSWTPPNSPLNVKIDKKTADAIANQTATIWFYGSVLYQDVFGIEHATRFRWSRREIMNYFGPHGGAPYNERT